MKMNGEPLVGPAPEIIPFSRTVEVGGARVERDIIFQVGPILDTEEFDAICPSPTPPMTRKPGDTVGHPDYDHPQYRADLLIHQTRYLDWLVIKGLSYTKWLTWDKVVMSDPDTWAEYDTELKDSGFTKAERQHIRTKALQYNSIDYDKMAEATKRFLAGQAAGQKS